MLDFKSNYQWSKCCTFLEITKLAGPRDPRGNVTCDYNVAFITDTYHLDRPCDHRPEQNNQTISHNHDKCIVKGRCTAYDDNNINPNIVTNQKFSHFELRLFCNKKNLGHGMPSFL